jgi:GPH family glycoside/pentoside/hexuronide:cation symporter
MSESIEVSPGADGVLPRVSPPGAAPVAPRIPLGAIVTYSVPPLGLGFMFMLVTLLLLKFSTDVLLIAPAAMGTIFMVGRLWDAISDPLAGYLSDNTRTRWGRRRPFIFASALPVAATFVMMWSPPGWLTGGGLVLWMAVAVLGFYSAMTILIVPHTSLGAELTTSYHDRTRIFGVRQVSWNLGMFLTLGGMHLLATSETPRASARELAIVAAVATAGLILWSAARLRERPEFQGRGGANPYRAFGDVFRNPHARLLLFVFLIESTGGATVGALTIYFSEYVLLTPSWTVSYIAAYLVAATISIPFWVPVSRRVGKKNLWFFSMGMTGMGFGSTFLMGEGDVVPLLLVASVLGMAAGCGNVVGPSIQADIIDWDEHRTGERKEGAYFAAWNFVFKTATGITLGITGFVLQAAGFEPNVEQSETSRLAIRSLYGLFPLVCYAVGAALFLRFSFNEKEYAVIRREIDQRNQSPGDET